MRFPRASLRSATAAWSVAPLAWAVAAACCAKAACDAPPRAAWSARGAESGDAGAEEAERRPERSEGEAGPAPEAAKKRNREAAPMISVVAAQGHRPYMEDTHFIARDGSFVGVYDGHGGSRVSAYLKKELHGTFKRRWSAGVKSGAAAPEDAVEMLREAFAEVDAAVQRNTGIAIEGSTAAVVLVPHLLPGCVEEAGPRRYFTANVGDSRAVLSRKGEAVDLTEDHKPNAAGERRRVEQLGGSVKWFGYYDTEGKPMKGTGVWRINGNLAVARAFGDRFDRPYVSGECDLKAFEVHEDDDQFIIVASDGLWDVMTSTEAVQFVQSMMAGSVGALREGGGGGAQGNRPSDVDLRTWSSQYSKDRPLVRAALMSRKKKMAKYLVEEALRRGTFDNITVAILWLK